MEKPLQEGAFFFTRRTLFPPLDKRNVCDKAKGLRVTSERYIGGLWTCDALAHEIEDWTCGNDLYWFTRRPLLVRMSKPYCFLSVAL